MYSAELGACQVVPVVLGCLAGGGEHVQVTSDASSFGESRLQGLAWKLTTVVLLVVFIV